MTVLFANCAIIPVPVATACPKPCVFFVKMQQCFDCGCDLFSDRTHQTCSQCHIDKPRCANCVDNDYQLRLVDTRCHECRPLMRKRLSKCWTAFVYSEMGQILPKDVVDYVLNPIYYLVQPPPITFKWVDQSRTYWPFCGACLKFQRRVAEFKFICPKCDQCYGICNHCRGFDDCGFCRAYTT
jgi:hypothetical protein